MYIVSHGGKEFDAAHRYSPAFPKAIVFCRTMQRNTMTPKAFVSDQTRSISDFFLFYDSRKKYL